MTIGSVDGLVSGMSTSSIIDQLIKLESRGQEALKSKAATQQKIIAAFQFINTKVAALGTASAALTQPDAFKAMRVVSSSDAVSATASSSALGGSLTFNVTALAAAASQVSTGTNALTDAVTAGPSISISKGGGAAVVINVTDTSLKGVVDAINAKPETGVRAAAVQVSPGQYRLQLSSTTTGANSNFSVTGLSVGMTALTTGADATVHVGPVGGGYDVTSPSNTFSEVLPGVTFTAKRLEDNVKIDVSSDIDTVSGRVKGMVDALNNSLAEIALQSNIHTDRTKSGVLAGDFLARSMSSDLLSSVSKALPAGGTLADVGIQTTRDGRVNFDAAKFKTAFEADPAKVAAMFGQGSSYTGGASNAVSVQGVTYRTVEGDHPVVITKAATAATATYAGSTNANRTYSVTMLGKTATYVSKIGDNMTAVTAGLQAAAATAELPVTITSDGATGINFTATKVGAAYNMTLSAVASMVPSSTSGTEIEGTIGGLAAKGTGSRLSTIGLTGASADITIDAPVTSAQVAAAGGTIAGNVNVTAGFAQRLETMGKKMSDKFDGIITKTIESKQNSINGYNDQIAAWDVRLAAKRISLRKQYTALESALGKMREQSNWLAGQVSGLPGPSS